MTYAKFFKTEQKAKEFQKKQGKGIIYKNTLRSRTKRDYEIAANALGLSDSDREKLPFVVEFNV